MVHIERIDDTARFDALKDAWGALAAAGAHGNVFLTWEWLRPWWRHLAGSHRLAIFAVYAGDELVALLPLCRRRQGLGRLAPTLEFLGTGMAGSDYLDVLVKPGFEESAIQALGDVLAAEGAHLSLRGVAAGATHLGRLLERLGERGWNVSGEASEICPFLPLTGDSFEAYLGSLGSKHRYSFRKKLRDLEKKHGLDWRAVASESERGEALEALYSFHDARWSGEGGSDAFSGAAIRAFHHEVTRLAVDRGALRLFVLRIDGRPAAVLYGFRLGTKFAFYQMGWSDGHAALSLGLILAGLGIRSAIEEGASEFDFLHGDEPYKFHWTQTTRALSRLEAYPPSPLGTALRGTRLGLLTAKRTARRILPGPWAEALAAKRRAGLWRSLRAAAHR